MSQTISIEKKNELFENFQNIGFSNHADGFETSWSFMKIMGKLPKDGFQHVTLNSGIELTFIDCNPNVISIPIFKIDQAPLQFAFHISGKGRCHLTHYLGIKETVDAGPGKTIISFNPESKCRVEPLGRQRIRVLNIYLSPYLLYTLLNEDLDQMPLELRSVLDDSGIVPYNRLANITPRIRMTLDQILNCPYQGALRQMYLEGKALELIVHQLSQLSAPEAVQRNHLRLRPDDLDRIHKAKDILLSDMENPPSLLELARKAGLNDTKLKRGFRQVFGTTVFGFFRHHRIDKSRELLNQGKLNLDEIAYLSGFCDTSHFIKDFSKHFGTTPGTYLKQSLQ